jgi:hypothetical protein
LLYFTDHRLLGELKSFISGSQLPDNWLLLSLLFLILFYINYHCILIIDLSVVISLTENCIYFIHIYKYILNDIVSSVFISCPLVVTVLIFMSSVSHGFKFSA